MRVFSALTFILTSAVLEHSKLFVEAPLPPRTSFGQSAGWEKVVEYNDHSVFSTVFGSFNVPQILGGAPGNRGLFIGMTLGLPDYDRETRCGTAAGVSAGVVVYVDTDSNPTFKPAYQVSTYGRNREFQHRLHVIEVAPFVISSGDTMLVTITVTGPSTVWMEIKHFSALGTPPQSLTPRPHVPAMSLCNIKYAWWGFGQLISPQDFDPIPMFRISPIVFSPAGVFLTDTEVEAAVNPISYPQYMWDGTEMVAGGSRGPGIEEITVQQYPVS